jgi:VanZ family protein
MRTLVAAQLLKAICVCVLFCILVAGLWPFHAPGNDVSWLSEGNGLLFGRHGSIVSAGLFELKPAHEGTSCSLEIWLKPAWLDSGGMILAFYNPHDKAIPFALRQYRDGLVLEHLRQGDLSRRDEIYVGEVFGGPNPVLVTMTSSGAGTTIYVDGSLRKKASNFVFLPKDLTGQLVVGDAPRTSYSWSGELKGLAVYDRERTGTEIASSLADWTTGSRPDSVESDAIVARYLFDEGKGRVVRNRVDSATNLLIPERFFVIHPQFLERPWDEFRPSLSYFKDAAVNIFGFVPLGFCFGAYFTPILRVKKATWLTVALGFAVSLTIEVLQSFLPTRDSGMTDLITNTFGTALGVTLYVCGEKRQWFAWVRF